MGGSDVVEYRLPSARIVIYASVAAVVAAIVLTVFVPSRDFSSMIPLALLGGWLAWVIWTVPSIEMSRTRLVVRNSLHTVTIPLAVITSVSGGKRLTIRTAGGRTYIPAAAAGGASFLLGAVRRTDAFGSFIVPVSRIDALRMDAERELTPATVIARMIEKRMRELPVEEVRAARSRDGTLRDVAPPVLNREVILGTIGVAAASIALFIALN
jgi:hypothetical protein